MKVKEHSFIIRCLHKQEWWLDEASQRLRKMNKNMNKNIKKEKTRQALLKMLWKLEKASEGCVIEKGQGVTRKQFAKKYNCRDKNRVFVK